MSNYSRDGSVILYEGEKIADYYEERHTVSSDKPILGRARGYVNDLFDFAPRYEVKGEESPDVPEEEEQTAEAAPAPEGEIDWSKAPAQTSSQGDKTPAFVEWVRDNHPEEFKRRYANRKTHLSQAQTEQVLTEPQAE